MPQNDKPKQHIIATLGNSIQTLLQNQSLLKPYLVSIFIQLLILEILFFATRFPLKILFEKIIRYVWGIQYIHYPWNLTLISPALQQIQILFFIFVSSFLIATATSLLNDINENKTPKPLAAAKNLLPLYLHIILLAALSYCFVWVLYQGYGLIYHRALMIGAKTGWKFILKAVIIFGTPYFNLILGALTTTLIAYAPAAIAIDRKKILSALKINFGLLRHSFLLSFGLILIPYLCFIPILFLRSIAAITMIPEMTVWVLVVSIIAMVAIDAVVYTALATVYLLNKEDR